MKNCNLADYANPLVGTDSTDRFSHGNIYPLIALPFGMIGLTSCTNLLGNYNRWIYRYGDSVKSFKVTHEPSPWMGDYGDFSISPLTGDSDNITSANEIAKPYLYSVDMADLKGRENVKVKFTPTERCGYWHFEFISGRKVIYFDTFEDAGEYTSEGFTLAGVARHNTGGVPENFGNYFFASFNEAFTFNQITPNRISLVFDDKVKDVYMSLGTSFISREQARLNLSKEIGKSTFKEIAEKAKAKWNKTLENIQIDGASEEQIITFYTNCYRGRLFPRVFHEYGDKDNEFIHYSPYTGRTEKGKFYTDNGFWDTFRTIHPLLTIIDPALEGEMLQSWVDAYKEGGWLPKWPSPGYRDCMIDTPLPNMFWDAISKGITNFDIASAYEACYKDATIEGTGNYGREGLEDYIKYGYVPQDNDTGTVEYTSRTLEYAYNDYCLAQMAEYLGRKNEKGLFLKRSINYRNVFDQKDNFMKGRLKNGSWDSEFNPFDWGGPAKPDGYPNGGPFTEGSSWHYTFYAPHDINGLIALFGGDKAFIEKLDLLLDRNNTQAFPKFYNDVIHEMREMAECKMGQYQASNQPVHNFLYLYNFVGQPWKAAKEIRNVVDTLYGPDPDGYPGDEDNGEMASWYVFSALGFYPVSPGYKIPYYVIGSPRFPKAVIRLPEGKAFEIIAHNNSDKNIYVLSVKLNGVPYHRTWIHHSDIAKGGKIEFEMGCEPGIWGSTRESFPVTYID